MLKRKKIKIQIEEPCRVNPENFTKIKGGYFCDQCQKCVGDYTSYSDHQLYATFSKKEDRCGIFRPEQLEKVYQYKSNKTATGFFSSLLLSGFLLASKNGNAQSELEVDTIVENKSLAIDSVEAMADSTDTTSVAKQEITPVVPDSQQVSISTKEFQLELENIIWTEHILLGFVQAPEVPQVIPFQNLIDSTKKAVAAMMVVFTGKKPNPPAPANPLKNTDKPVWLESLKNRFRRKKKKSM